MENHSIFGEVYWQLTSRTKLTIGLRYFNEKQRKNEAEASFAASIDLNDTLVNDPEGQWILLRAAAINNDGEIVGYGVYRGQYQAFLLTAP